MQNQQQFNIFTIFPLISNARSLTPIFSLLDSSTLYVQAAMF